LGRKFVFTGLNFAWTGWRFSRNLVNVQIGIIKKEKNVSEKMPAMKLELVPIGVADVDRAKEFYTKAGFHLNVDVKPIPEMRVVQFTPPGSACSIVFGTGMQGISHMKPGSITALHLVVDKIAEARQALIDRGVAVGEVSDMGGVKYAGFSDVDGNSWLLQEFPAQLRSPGQSFYDAKDDR
jgi:catechol 2,3-dioxygenase-like lactoylglutathione lyase family enzyme